MVSVEFAWHQAWSSLDADARASISRADGHAPADYFVKALFPGLFADLDSSLRSVVAIKRGQCAAVQAEAIAAAVSARREHLDAVGRLMPALRAGVVARGLTWTKERDPMARLASRLAGAGAVGNDAAVVERALERHYLAAVPDADGVRAALRDDALVAQLEGELARKGTYRADHECTGDCVLDELLDRFLDAGLVDHGGAPTEVDGEEAWAAVRAHPCLPAVHRYAHGLGLCRDVVPSAPSVRAAPLDAQAWHERHRLDSSLEERVAGALRGDRQQRSGLPPERTLLLEETDRAARPLGLGTETSCATVALARRVLLRLPARDDARSRVVTDVRQRFARWQAEARQVGIYPRLPPSVRNAAEDPDLWYVSLLWRRVHGHETRRVQETSAVAAHRVLTGIAVTVVERLRQAPGTLATGIDDVARTAAAPAEPVSGSGGGSEPDDAADVRVTELLRAAGRALGRDRFTALVAELFECHRAGEPVGGTWSELSAAAAGAGPSAAVGAGELAGYLDRHAG